VEEGPSPPMWQRQPPGQEGRGQRDADGRATRVGYILRRRGFESHSNIVTRICLARGSRRGEASTVVTASRDGTLKCWDIPALEKDYVAACAERAERASSSSASPTTAVGGASASGGSSSSTSPPPAAPAPQLRCSLEEHTAWVNDAIVLPPVPGQPSGVRRAISASNDQLVKVWHIDEERQGSGVVGALLSLRFHIDYVTCLAYAPHRALLASAGLDTRIVVSDLEAATRVLALSAATDGEDSFSGGSSGGGGMRGSRNLGSAANAIQQRCTVGQFSGSGQYLPQLLASPPRVPKGGQDRGSHAEDGGGGLGGSCSSSVWSLATTRSGSLLVCGTMSCAIRAWDPRSGAPLWRLRGHTENVRSVVLSEDGRTCVSGSADRTVRLWDLGMQRCVHVFDAHHDSVWALTVAGHSCGYAVSSGDVSATGAGGSLGHVFSGGRDGLVLMHDLRQLRTGLVVREPSGLQALAIPADMADIWASAADSHVRRHAAPAHLVPYPTPSGHDAAPPGSTMSLDRASAGAFPTGGSGFNNPPPPSPQDEGVAIPGTPRLVEHRVLHNKRQVLTKDALGHLSIWDVTSGQLVDCLSGAIGGPPEKGEKEGGLLEDDVMRRTLAQLDRPVSVPNWFSCDLALGGLTVYLDAASCFKAELEAAELESNCAAQALSQLALATSPAGGANGCAPRRPSSGNNHYGGGGGRGGSNSAVEETDSESGVVVNLGIRTLRALFDGWLRRPFIGTPGSRSSQQGRNGGSSHDRAWLAMARARYGNQDGSGSRRSSGSSLPRVFEEPPPPEPPGGGARRWVDDQPPGTPADRQPASQSPGELQGGAGPLVHSSSSQSSSSSFPSATALLLCSRNGRATVGRGRLYCGFFCGSEAPEMFPPWVVDVVWHQRSPPEELCGERTMAFSLVRCPSEVALPILNHPRCQAAPRTRIRRLMNYLVSSLDFDWAAPPVHNTSASGGGSGQKPPRTSRPSSAVSLLARFGCCTAPATRDRSRDRGAAAANGSSGDGSGASASGGAASGNPGGRRHSGGKRSRSNGANRGGSSASAADNCGGGGSSSRSRSSPFTLRSGGGGQSAGRDEDGSGAVGYGGSDRGGAAERGSSRVRIDGSPASLHVAGDNSAQTSGRLNNGASGASLPSGAGCSPGASPDDRCIEILCNDEPLDPEMSLATVRDFVWKTPNAELVLRYRRAPRGNNSSSGNALSQPQPGGVGVGSSSTGPAAAAVASSPPGTPSGPAPPSLPGGSSTAAATSAAVVSPSPGDGGGSESSGGFAGVANNHNGVGSSGTTAGFAEEQRQGLSGGGELQADAEGHHIGGGGGGAAGDGIAATDTD